MKKHKENRERKNLSQNKITEKQVHLHFKLMNIKLNKKYPLLPSAFLQVFKSVNQYVAYYFSFLASVHAISIKLAVC